MKSLSAILGFTALLAACSSRSSREHGPPSGEALSFKQAWAYTHVMTKGQPGEVCIQFLDIPGNCILYEESAGSWRGPYIPKNCDVEVDPPFLRVTCDPGSAHCGEGGDMLYFYSDGNLTPGLATYKESPEARAMPVELSVNDSNCDNLIVR